MENVFFFQTQQIADDTNIFNQFKEQKIFYSYFQVDQNYYLFVYSQKSIDINFVYQSVEIIQELDSKQRKIRSLRGFFLYALEIMEKGLSAGSARKDHEILQTNLQSFFWKQVHNIIRQNKKGALQEFLFGSEVTRMGSTYGRGEVYTILDTSSSPALDAKIQTLQKSYDALRSQVQSLQQKVIQLEAKLMRIEQSFKYPLIEPSQPLESSKTVQQGNYTLNSNMGSLPNKSFQENDTNFHQAQEASFKSLSEDSRIHFKNHQTTQEYSIPSNQKKGLNEQNFITLSNLSEDQKIEIIKLGFQLNQQGKISLKKYYETTQEYSLFQFKGYSIKYETIRRTKLYQQLKLSNN